MFMRFKLVSGNVPTSRTEYVNQFGQVNAAAILSAKISNARRSLDVQNQPASGVRGTSLIATLRSPGLPLPGCG